MWKAWKLIHGAKDGLVTEVPYVYVRHPQYSGLFVVMIGMLIQWPTVITALIFPVLVFVYYRLARREEPLVLLRVTAKKDLHPFINLIQFTFRPCSSHALEGLRRFEKKTNSDIKIIHAQELSLNPVISRTSKIKIYSSQIFS